MKLGFAKLRSDTKRVQEPEEGSLSIKRAEDAQKCLVDWLVTACEMCNANPISASPWVSSLRSRLLY